MQPPDTQLPIIQTKLCPPGLTSDTVSRGRLMKMMDRSLELPLTIVSAPAGYGKSVLASQWLHRQQHHTAWLSLDPADSDLHQFLVYLVAAIRVSEPESCNALSQILQLADPPPVGVLGSHLLNDLDALTGTWTIVLDDYHRLESSSKVNELIEFVMSHPPRMVHIVLLTRRDPPLALSSLRAGNQMYELRMQDLRFTRSEISAMLAASTGHAASDNAVANLQKEMEGWAVGLRLVSLVLKHAKNPDDFLESLRGGVPQIQEYLVSEVLAGLPAAVRERLLDISILDRFCAPLIDALGEDAEISPNSSSLISADELIQTLVKSNLFVINLDPNEEWFRFHHLFRELLVIQLEKERNADEIMTLQLLAAAWFEQQNLISDAIRYALEAGEAEFAADLVEQHRTQALDLDQWFLIELWMSQLPDPVKSRRLALMLTEFHVAYSRFDLERIQILLERIQEMDTAGHLDATIESEMLLQKSMLAYWHGEVETSLELSEQGLKLDAEGAYLKGEHVLYESLSLQALGARERALQLLHQHVQTNTAITPMLQTRIFATQCYVNLLSAEPLTATGDAKLLRVAATEGDLSNALAWSNYLDGTGLLQSMDLERCIIRFRRVVNRQNFFERVAATDNIASLALAYQLLGQPEDAAEAIGELKTYANNMQESNSHLVAESCQARLSVLQGETASALAWARAFPGEANPMGLFVWSENPPLTAARVKIIVGNDTDRADALNLLDSLLPELRRLHNRAQLIEVQVLRAIALDFTGLRRESHQALDDALAKAEPGGWKRPFVELSQPLSRLVNRYSDQTKNKVTLAWLVSTMGRHFGDAALLETASPRVSAARQSSPEVHDGLTNRELDILELLAQRLQNKEIANQLFISTHTVKDHLKHIYQKLGVSNRRQAVTRAIDSGIIPPS